MSNVHCGQYSVNSGSAITAISVKNLTTPPPTTLWQPQDSTLHSQPVISSFKLIFLLTNQKFDNDNKKMFAYFDDYSLQLSKKMEPKHCSARLGGTFYFTIGFAKFLTLHPKVTDMPLCLISIENPLYKYKHN